MPRNISPEAHAALERCYEAVLFPNNWPDALHALARSFDTVGCCLLTHGLDGDQRLQLPASWDYAAFLKEFVAEGWWRHDHRAERGWPLLKHGRKALVEHDLVREDERKRLAVYHDLYSRYDVPWWGCVAFLVDGRPWVMPFLRSESQGPFARADASALLALAPHLERLIKLGRHMGMSHAGNTLEAFDNMDVAALLVDWKGTVAATNRKANSLLDRDFVISQNRLVVADSQGQRDIDALFAQLTSTSGPRDFDRAEPVIVRRRSGAPLLVDAIPAVGAMGDALQYTRAIILITDPAEKRMPSEETLQRMFGLTRSEARLAVLVGSGLPPAEAAQILGVKRETSRTDLKRIFEKTGVSRQSQLSALVSRLGLISSGPAAIPEIVPQSRT